MVGYGDKAVLINDDLSAAWNGTGWQVVEAVTLTPLTQDTTWVQFGNVCDFGVPADNTALSFHGEVLLNGVAVNDVQFIGYPGTETICLNNINHPGQILTIKEGSLIYYEDKAVVVEETFNAIWDGSKWVNVVGEASLSPIHYTNSLVQFGDFYDFELPSDNTVLDFYGTVLINGNPATNGTNFNFTGYTSGSSKICFNLAIAATEGQTVIIKAGSLVGYEGKAVLINDDLSATWNGSAWVLN